MTITPEQLEARKSVIGSSDVAAIMGYSPFANAADVYWDKVGLERDRPERPWMKNGTWLEFPMLQRASAIFDVTIDAFDVNVPCEDHPIFAANLDAITSEQIPLEAKTVLIGSPSRADWGAPGTDLVPDHVMLQVQHQMLCTGAEKAHVIAFNHSFNLIPYTVRRSEDLLTKIIDACYPFWFDHVTKGIPPDDMPSTETLSLIPRVKDKIVRVDDELAADYIAKREAESIAKIDKQKAGDAIKLAMGDGELSHTFGFQCTYKANTKGDRTLLVKENKQ